MKAAADTSLRDEGVFCLTVEISGHKAQAAFGVAPKLAIKTILCKAFTDRETERFQTKSRQIVPKSKHTVGFAAKPEAEAVV